MIRKYLYKDNFEVYTYFLASWLAGLAPCLSSLKCARCIMCSVADMPCVTGSAFQQTLASAWAPTWDIQHMFQPDAAWEEPKCHTSKSSYLLLCHPSSTSLQSRVRQRRWFAKVCTRLIWGSPVFPRTHLSPASSVSLQQYDTTYRELFTTGNQEHKSSQVLCIR